MTRPLDPPKGFHRVERPRRNPFNELVGPFYERREGETVTLGLRIEERHLNSRGFCHGGLLATLADLALGYAMLAATQGHTNFVTVHLSIDYVDAAKEGDWIESQVDIQRVASRLAFANCYLIAGERRIVHASAIFALPGK
jgi:acyl-coenzyme A thioesterase 13